MNNSILISAIAIVIIIAYVLYKTIIRIQDWQTNLKKNQPQFYLSKDDKIPIEYPNKIQLKITKQNNEETDIFIFDILNHLFRNKTFPENIKVESQNMNLSYDEILLNLLSKKYELGYSQMTTNDKCYNSKLFIIRNDINGNESTCILGLGIDPYQFQSGIIHTNQKIEMDYNTKIKITISKEGVYIFTLRLKQI